MARKLIEGEVHDPFTRRKTQPKIAQVEQYCLPFAFNMFNILYSQNNMFVQIKKDGPAVNPLVVEAAKEKESVEAAKEKEKKDEEEKKENKPLDDLFRYRYISQQFTFSNLLVT